MLVDTCCDGVVVEIFVDAVGFEPSVTCSQKSKIFSEDRGKERNENPEVKWKENERKK